MIDMVQAVIDKKAEKIQRYPCKSNRASGMGYYVPELNGCIRRGVYERTNWREKELTSPELQLIFDEGNNQEQLVLLDLASAGVAVIEQQTPFDWTEYNITGHIDGKVIDESGVAVPIEIKSMSPNIFAGVHCYADFKKKPWTHAYMAQITLYMLMQNIDSAVFVLKNKSTGMLKQIEVELDYDLGEACIKTAEAINSHVATKTMPARITDREVCKRCPFRLICLPDVNLGVPLRLVDDPEYESRLDRHMLLKESAAEDKKLWDLIREEAKAQAGDSGELNTIVGKYHVTGKTGSNGAFRLKVDVLGNEEVDK